MRGGFWRNFMARYPEINTQHKKMLRVHDQVYAAGATTASGTVDLWKAQANDTYWHGLFGGIYMAHVRSAIYHHLIKAENAAAHFLQTQTPWQRYEFTDFDRDTQDELIIESDQQNLYIDPQRGGTIFEWDMRRSTHNLTCVMTRQLEGYHQTLREHEQERRRKALTPPQTTHSESEPASPHTTIRTKEADLDHYLVIDLYRRNCLVDHFLPSGLPLADFASAHFEDLGNFVEQLYATTVEQTETDITVTMARDGQVRRPGALSPLPIQLTKTLFIPTGEEKLIVHYSITNKGQARLQTNFACEWNFNLLGGGGNDQAYYAIPGQHLSNKHFDSTGEVPSVQIFQIGNSWLQQAIQFELSSAATLWRFSIDTITGSEAGFERTHQGSCATLIWPLTLEAAQTWNVEIVCTGSNPAEQEQAKK
jgi:alpha-amylase